MRGNKWPPKQCRSCERGRWRRRSGRRHSENVDNLGVAKESVKIKMNFSECDENLHSKISEFWKQTNISQPCIVVVKSDKIYRRCYWFENYFHTDKQILTNHNHNIIVRRLRNLPRIWLKGGWICYGDIDIINFYKSIFLKDYYFTIYDFRESSCSIQVYLNESNIENCIIF